MKWITVAMTLALVTSTAGAQTQSDGRGNRWLDDGTLQLGTLGADCTWHHCNFLHCVCRIPDN